MYLNVAVPIPDDNKVITKKVNDTEYHEYFRRIITKIIMYPPNPTKKVRIVTGKSY